MLHAIKKHKVKADVHLEDAKTSSIMGTLCHLPASLLWQLIYKATAEDRKLPAVATELLQVDFWPSWKIDDRIEPDVFLRFKEFDLILEMKVDNGNKQYKQQWKRELEAYHLRYPECEKSVYLIAVSGRTNQEHPSVVQCSWSSLLDAVVQELERQESVNPYSAEVRILKDSVMAFNIHKEYHYTYFEDIDYDVHQRKISEHLNIFCKHGKEER